MNESSALEQWILGKIEPYKSAPLVIVRDPQRMIAAGAKAVDGWAEDNGFTVLFCSGNLALREMYERMRDEPGLHALLVDRSRDEARTPLYYPDIYASAGPQREMNLTLHSFLEEKTGDRNWPPMVNDRKLSRLLLANLNNVLIAHAQLRAVRPAGFSDADLYKIILGAALGIDPFRKLSVNDVRRVSLEHHKTLEELNSLLPSEAMDAWRKALAQVPKPFCWLLERNTEIVVRAFTLAAILHQHQLDYRLLLGNLDPQLFEYKEIDAAFVEEALHDQVVDAPERVMSDVRDAEQSLQDDSAALQLILRDQLKLDERAHAYTALQRERLSPLIRAMALFSLLADLLANRDIKFHRTVIKLLGEQEQRTDIPALRRPDEAWLTVVNVYRKAFKAIELVSKLVKPAKELAVTADDQLDFERFNRLWNKEGLNRLDYYLSDVKRTLRVGAILPVPQRLFWPELEQRWQQARREFDDTMNAATQALNFINAAFQKLYLLHYTEWIQQGDAPAVFTHQFLDRVVKANWDPQSGRKAVILVFDGMRTDAFQELLLPVLEERYRITREFPGSAILPTETHFSRKALAAGCLPINFKSKSELELLKRWLRETMHLNPQFDVLKDDDTVQSGMTVRYRSDKLEYIVFNFTDKNLHHNAQELAFIYDTTVGEIIRQDVRSVLRDLPSDAVIFVTSDHGFSPVPTTSVTPDADWITAPNEVNYRVARTRKSVPESARKSVVVFDARKLGIPLDSASGVPIHSIAFPRPGLTLKRPNWGFQPDAYTHGGLSMAECFVPMIVLGPRSIQQPVLKIERFEQTGSLREGEPLTLELTLVPSRTVDTERIITIEFSQPQIGTYREIFTGKAHTISITWNPKLDELGELERTESEVRLPVTAIVRYTDNDQLITDSRLLLVRIKIDTSRLRRRVDSKLDLLMGKVPKGLQG